MGNFWKYNDRVSTGAGVTGLDTADGGDAIADNEIIRGDGATGIQGGVLTSADHNGDISGPTASTDTTVAGGDFANQPANDSITVASDNAADTGITVTLIGTTNGVDTVVVEALPLDGTDATTPVVSVKVDWGILLAAKLSGAAAGNITIQKTTGPATIIAIATPNTSAGVDTGSISCWNRIPYVVASGASTKQIGLKGTNSAGATIYDSQALTGATSLLMNSAFVTVTEYYVGDLESTRTATITAQGGTKIDGNFVLLGSTGATDNAILRADGTGGVTAKNSALTLSNTGISGVLLGIYPNYGIRFHTDGRIGIKNNGTDATWINGQNVGGLRLGQSIPLTWTNATTADPDYSTADTGLARSAAGVVKVTDGSTGLGSLYGSVVGSITANGASTNIKTSATTVNLSGATSTATGLFPAKCIQLGVTVRVTTLAASGDGGTSMNIGDGSDADRYGATIAFAAGTTVNLSDATADPRGWAAAAGDVVFTCVGGTFNAGVVRVVAHYLDLTASTS